VKLEHLDGLSPLGFLASSNSTAPSVPCPAAAERWLTAPCRRANHGTVQAPVGADNVLSGRFTEEEPEEASSLLNLRPCRIRYDVTKEWTNFCRLERASPDRFQQPMDPGVPFGEDNSDRAIQSGVKQRLNSAST
jgi:hypothetical protein